MEWKGDRPQELPLQTTLPQAYSAISPRAPASLCWFRMARPEPYCCSACLAFHLQFNGVCVHFITIRSCVTVPDVQDNSYTQQSDLHAGPKLFLPCPIQRALKASSRPLSILAGVHPSCTQMFTISHISTLSRACHWSDTTRTESQGLTWCSLQANGTVPGVQEIVWQYRFMDWPLLQGKSEKRAQELLWTVA